jgi:importin subunit beta-1
LDTLPVKHFIYKENLSSADWKLKNESLLIFGCLLDSPYKDKIKDILQNSIAGLLKLLSDEVIYIRKTVSWVICKVTELYPRVFDKNILNTVVPILKNSLNDINYVAVNICYSFNNLIKILGDKETIKNNSKKIFNKTLFHLSLKLYSKTYLQLPIKNLPTIETVMCL